MRQVLAALILGVGLAAAQTPEIFISSVVRCPCVGNAADWGQDTRFRGVWTFEERDLWPSSQKVADHSSYGFNILAPNTQLRTRFDQRREGCRAADTNFSTTIACQCQAGDGCVAANFQIAGSYSLGCWERPRDVTGDRFTVNTTTTRTSTGYALGWNQAALGSGRFRFATNHSGGNVILASASTYTPNSWHHHVGRYTTGASRLMEQLIDGVLDANTATASSDPPSAWSDTLQIGAVPFNGDFVGDVDECWVYADLLTNAAACRIAVCGVNGCGCVCDPADPTMYLDAPNHVSFGGSLSCTLPPCNQPTPDSTTTTTTTSTTTTTT